MMSRLNERDQRALRFGMVGAALVVLFMVVVLPAMEYHDKLQKRLNDARTELANAASDLADAADAQGASRELEAVATLHRNPKDLNQQTARMLQQLGDCSAYQRINVRRLEGLALRSDDKFYRSSLSLQFSGTLQDLHLFLQQVQDSKPQLRVDRLSMATDPENPGRVQGQMIITGFAVVTSKQSTGTSRS